MKVIKWMAYSQIEAEGMKKSVDLFGGFFTDGMKWQDYLDNVHDRFHHYLEAIRESVLENNLRITGEEHQYSGAGVPVFDDGTVATMSFRGWGDIMAAIWSEAEGKDYNYMDFYM